MLTADGISLEAFQLSDQANILHEKNILPLVRMKNIPKNSAFSSFMAKTSAMQKGSGNNKQGSGISSSPLLGTGKGLEKKGKDGEKEKKDNDEIVGDKIELDGEVLIRSVEVTSVDCMFFAVPLPISTLKNTAAINMKNGKNKINNVSTGNSGGKGTKENKDNSKDNGKDSADSGIEFEHSFPSECEMQGDHDTMRLAKLHFTRILSSLSSDTIKERMRDPHLLLYISRILDLPTRDSLCRSLLDKNTQLPGMVKVALDMVKMSLDTSRSDSNSKGKRSGRFFADDDDDE